MASILSSSLDTRLAAGSADSIVLVIHREWPVWQLFKHIVDHALSSGSFLSKVIASSYEQPTFFVPRSRKGISRLWNPRYSFPCEQLRWTRLMPRDLVREMLTAKPWLTANFLTVRTVCSWYRNGPTRRGSLQLHNWGEIKGSAVAVVSSSVFAAALVTASRLAVETKTGATEGIIGELHHLRLLHDGSSSCRRSSYEDWKADLSVAK